MLNYYVSSILKELAGSVLSSVYDLLPSFNGFDGLTEAHGGSGSTYNKRRRAKSKASGGGGSYKGGGGTPQADARKQALVKKHSQMALADPKNYRKNTSLASRKIVSNFQLQKQINEKDVSAAIKKSRRRMTDKQMKFVTKTGKRPNFGPSKINYL